MMTLTPGRGVAFDGTYLMSVTLRGPDRDDATASQAAVAVARALFDRLPR